MTTATTPPPRPGRADALVLLGLTGDLGDKKLLPALAQLATTGELDHPVVSVARSLLEPDEIRARAAEAADDDRREVERRLADVDLRTVRGGLDEEETWAQLEAQLEGCELPVVYAAVPPDLFGTLAERVAGSRLPATTRLVLEKPFGHDEASARQLWDRITDLVPPEQVFVVDHFLAKAAIENLLTVRTCNAVIANNLQPGSVAAIDVVMHERGGADGRGSFYESVGAVRDVVQNHVLQLLALATMAPPADASDECHAAARHELLASVAPVDPATVTLGQYDGYRDLDDVAPDSDIETFASMRVTIDAEPWRGVPVRLETGKALHQDRTAVLFTVRGADGARPGRIVFDISPRPCISIELEVLDGDDHGLRPITLSGRPDDDHDGLGDYATMLRSALRGERRHFATIEGILAGWRVVDPIARHRPEVQRYAPGSTGP